MVLCTTDDYRMLKIHVLCNYSLSLHFWLRQSGELGTVMCLDKTSHARETVSNNNFQPIKGQGIFCPHSGQTSCKMLRSLGPQTLGQSIW
ncbi:uncharacterized protein LOC112023681 isoform X6 [Quercus suber]|uniref:uncharacterized protein LOC112023681 isoform X6 n=1 Tax=Quercus suber TaxID=58331 RepID=UPI0032DFFAEE